MALRVHRSLTRGVLLGGFNPRDRARSHVELTDFEIFSVFVVYTERLDSTRDAEGVFGTSGANVVTDKVATL